MKKPLLLPFIALVGGAAAAVLRLLQNTTGFEEGTGLPIPGNLPATALVILLVLLAAVLILLVRRLPEKAAPAFPADFTARDPRLLFVPMAGLFLMGISGVLDLVAGLGLTETLIQSAVSAADPSGMTSVVAISSSDGYSSQAHLILGVLDLLAAAGLFFAVRACGTKHRHSRLRFNGTWLLAPVLAMAVRLVLAYRVDSVNPALEAYYVELLALVFLNLAFYRFSSFSFDAGRTRRFALYACCAVVLCLAAFCDSSSLSARLLEIGAGLCVLGFLLLHLTAASAPSGTGSEEIE
ncbi:MAG: hypothetical protein V8R55_08230 [Dysosmobacter sp.]